MELIPAEAGVSGQAHWNYADSDYGIDVVIYDTETNEEKGRDVTDDQGYYEIDHLPISGNYEIRFVRSGWKTCMVSVTGLRSQEERYIGYTNINDVEAPVLSSFTVPQYTYSDIIKMYVQAEDSGSGLNELRYSIDGGESMVVQYSEYFEIPIQLGYGYHSITVEVSDAAGNWSDSKTAYIRYL